MARIEFLSSKFHYSFGPHAPTLRVQSGAKLRVICPDCDNMLSDGTELRTDQRGMDDPVNPIQGNPLAGPIHVENAQQGDLLAVMIESIVLDRKSGVTLLAPNHGVVPSEMLATPNRGSNGSAVPRRLYQWNIDQAANTATIVNPIGEFNLSVPLRPFLGCIGVCPAGGQHISSLHCGPFGGNMDLPIINAGTTVFLPVYTDGALLMLGDLHAAQGHGELVGGGIETSGKVECTLTLLKGESNITCALLDKEEVSVIGTDDDLRQSIQQACGGLVNLLAEIGEINRFDLFNAISQAVRIVVGNLNKPPYPTAACMRLMDLPHSVCDALNRWM